MLQMIYPERRRVLDEQVIGWAQDSLVNSVIRHKQYVDDNEMDADILAVHKSEDYVRLNSGDLELAVNILADTGEATFIR